MKKMKCIKCDIDKNRSVSVGKRPDGDYQLTARNKIKGKKWQTATCTRDENNIVKTTIIFSPEGAIALLHLLLIEFGIDEKTN